MIETAHRRRQRLWRNAWLEELARAIEAKGKMFPGSTAHFAAAAQVVRDEKRLEPGKLTLAEERAQVSAKAGGFQLSSST